MNKIWGKWNLTGQSEVVLENMDLGRKKIVILIKGVHAGQRGTVFIKFYTVYITF